MQASREDRINLQRHLTSNSYVADYEWMSGWPDDKFKTPLCVREYWPHRGELSIHNGLVYRGTRIIIPTSMIKEMTATAHPWHLGIDNTTSSVRDIMYRL